MLSGSTFIPSMCFVVTIFLCGGRCFSLQAWEENEVQGVREAGFEHRTMEEGDAVLETFFSDSVSLVLVCVDFFLEMYNRCVCTQECPK